MVGRLTDLKTGGRAGDLGAGELGLEAGVVPSIES